METIKLETFRENDFGQIAFLLTTTPPITLQINFDLFAVHAYRFTARSIRDLEHSRKNLNNGLQNLPAVTMWYQSIHSFLNALLQLFSLKKGGNFEHLRQQSIESKYNYLLSLMSIGISETEKKLSEKLADLTRFEQGVKTAFVTGTGVKYHQANFSRHPMMLNQADVLQCMLIAVEIFQRLRFIIAGLDMMPNISLVVSENLVFDKLDSLFRSVIVPAFKDILSKHNLTIQLDLEDYIENYPVSEVFKDRDILIIGKVVEDEKFKRVTNNLKTDIMGNFFDQFVRKFEGNAQRFGRHYLAPGFNPVDRKI